MSQCGIFVHTMEVNGMSKAQIYITVCQNYALLTFQMSCQISLIENKNIFLMHHADIL